MELPKASFTLSLKVEDIDRNSFLIGVKLAIKNL